MISGNLVLAIAHVLRLFIQIYMVIILIRSIISWVGPVQYNQFTYILRKLTDPVFRFLHRVFPFMIYRNIDFSPIIILVLLSFINRYFIGLMIQYGHSLTQGG